jgi:dsDNA-specific endonuclease/ATPase MutS2
MDIEAIPGVGEKTAAALSELDDPERVLERGDVAAMTRAPGITRGRAARIARAAIQQRHDDPGEFLGTKRARELYDEALGLLQARTVTDYAASKLETLYPSAAGSRIEEIRAFATDAMERDPNPGVLDALADIEPLVEPTDVRVRERCLATTDAETYAEAQDAVPEVSVELVEGKQQLAELGRGYSSVIALDETFAGIDVAGDVQVNPTALDEPASVVPERTLTFFARNRERLHAAIEVHRVADLEAPCDLAALESALDELKDDGTVRGDEELDRLNQAIDDLDAAVSNAEKVANDRLRNAIEERDVTIEGADLLSLVEQGASVDSLLDRELTDEFEQAVTDAREHLIDTLDLQDSVDIARMIFPEDPTYPVEHDGSATSKLRTELTAMRDRRATRRKRELADTLAERRDDAQVLVENALELDVELAISRFATDFECTMPEFGSEGFTIEGGRSPLLDIPQEDVEPIDYDVDGVTLLSGVNSGGKTSLLDLVGLVVILSHMGLPVPADSVHLQRFGSLHYHAKNQGTLDAGAFESTLVGFQSLIDGIDEDEAGTLVLVDELESITEPGASANIMAGILEALSERGSTAVFVSHLAEEIQEAADSDLAVDGIQAKGLVDGELKVNRSPVKGRLARSTPELIVEKLADERTDATFYGRLLEKFEG